MTIFTQIIITQNSHIGYIFIEYTMYSENFCSLQDYWRPWICLPYHQANPSPHRTTGNEINTSLISDLQRQRLICITAYIYSLLRHDIYPYRHARAILMCLTLLNSFNHMKSFTMFIFSWLKFVKKRGTSIYLLRVYVMPSTLCIHCVFLLWHYS